MTHGYVDKVKFTGSRTGSGAITSWVRVPPYRLPTDVKAINDRIFLETRDVNDDTIWEHAWYQINAGGQLAVYLVVDTHQRSGEYSGTPPAPISFGGPVEVGSIANSQTLPVIGPDGRLINGKAVRDSVIFPDIVTIQARTDLVDGEVMFSLSSLHTPSGGGASIGAGPGILLQYDAGSAATHDGVTVFALSSGAPGRLLRATLEVQAEFVRNNWSVYADGSGISRVKAHALARGAAGDIDAWSGLKASRGNDGSPYHDLDILARDYQGAETPFVRLRSYGAAKDVVALLKPISLPAVANKAALVSGQFARSAADERIWHFDPNRGLGEVLLSDGGPRAVVANLADLRLLTPDGYIDGEIVLIDGSTFRGDGDVFMAYWSSGSTATDNNIDVFKPTAHVGGAAWVEAGRFLAFAPIRAIKFTDSDATPDVSGSVVFTGPDVAPAGGVTGVDGFRNNKRIKINPGASDLVFVQSNGALECPGRRNFVLKSLANGGSPIILEKENGVVWLIGGGINPVIPNAFAETTITLSSGSIVATLGAHKIDGEGGAADDLTNIDLSAFFGGSQVMFSIVSAARPITVKTSGNIATDTGTDIFLGSINDVLLVRKDGATARASKISRDAPSAQTAADVANVTALKAIVTATGLSDGARINLLGYTTVGDGGGGVLTYIAASTASPDDFRVFKPNDVTLPAAGRFVRVAQAVYDWRQAGCVLDGSTDDTARANVAAADTAVAAITGGGRVMGLNYTSGGALVANRNDLTVEDTEFLCLQPTSTTDNRVVRNNGDRNTWRRCRFNWGTAGIAVGHLSNDALFWNTGDDCTMDQCYATGDRKGSGFVNNGGTNFRCIKPIIENLRYSSTPTASTAVTGVSGANLTVSSITGFTNGSRIFVLMNDGGYYETSINGAPSGNTIVMATAPTRSSVDTTGGLVVQPSTVDDSIQAIWNNAATAAYIERPVIRNITGDIGFGQYNRFTRGIANGGCNGVDIVTPFIDNVDQGVDNTGSAANKGIRTIVGKIQNVRTWGVKHANSIIDCVVDDVLIENAGLACVVYSGPAESGLPVKTSRCTVAKSILKNPGWGTYAGSDAHACIAILKSTYDQDFPKGIKALGVRGVDDQAVTTTRYLFFSDVTQRAASGDDFNEMDEFCTFDYSGDGVSLNAENVSGAEAPVCSIYLTADQSIPDATWTEVLFTSEEYDPAQMHSTSSATGRIVIKRRGLYFVSGAIRFANNATGGRSIVLRHESANLYGGANQVAGHSTLSTYARASGYRYCEPGDELYMWAYQDSGGALNALTPETWLSAIRMPMNF